MVGNEWFGLARVTYVRENDFSVFLCRLETAMRAASCGKGGDGRLGGEEERLLFEKSRDDVIVVFLTRNVGSYLRVVGVLGGHGSGRFRGEFIELRGGDAGGGGGGGGRQFRVVWRGTAVGL